MTQWDFQNKGKSGWTGKSSFVLEVPLRHLRLSVIYSIPCDRILQRAYCSYLIQLNKSSPREADRGVQNARWNQFINHANFKILYSNVIDSQTSQKKSYFPICQTLALFSPDENALYSDNFATGNGELSKVTADIKTAAPLLSSIPLGAIAVVSDTHCSVSEPYEMRVFSTQSR